MFFFNPCKQLAQIVRPQEDEGIGAKGRYGNNHHTLITRNNTKDRLSPVSKIQVIVKGDDVLNGPQKSGYMSSTPKIKEFSCRSVYWHKPCISKGKTFKKFFDTKIYLVMNYAEKKTKKVGLNKISIEGSGSREKVTEIKTMENSEKVFFILSHDGSQIGEVSKEDWNNAEE